MLEESSDEIRSFHRCARQGCTRVFRESAGYLDRIGEGFDDSRSSLRSCPRCTRALYLAEVDAARKIETWECAQPNCGFSEDLRSPSAR